MSRSSVWVDRCDTLGAFLKQPQLKVTEEGFRQLLPILAPQLTASKLLAHAYFYRVANFVGPGQYVRGAVHHFQLRAIETLELELTWRGSQRVKASFDSAATIYRTYQITAHTPEVAAAIDYAETYWGRHLRTDKALRCIRVKILDQAAEHIITLDAYKAIPDTVANIESAYAVSMRRIAHALPATYIEADELSSYYMCASNISVVTYCPQCSAELNCSLCASCKFQTDNYVHAHTAEYPPFYPVKTTHVFPLRHQVLQQHLLDAMNAVTPTAELESDITRNRFLDVS